MAKVMIVPNEDYNILKKYLGVEDGKLVLIPESSLISFPPAAQTRCRELTNVDDVVYDFGDEPDICVDLVLSEDSYAYGVLIQESED